MSPPIAVSLTVSAVVAAVAIVIAGAVLFAGSRGDNVTNVYNAPTSAATANSAIKESLEILQRQECRAEVYRNNRRYASEREVNAAIRACDLPAVVGSGAAKPTQSAVGRFGW